MSPWPAAPPLPPPIIYYPIRETGATLPISYMDGVSTSSSFRVGALLLLDMRYSFLWPNFLVLYAKRQYGPLTLGNFLGWLLTGCVIVSNAILNRIAVG
jgi:hypothetical protein